MPKLLIATTVPSTFNAFLMPYVQHFRSLGWRVDGLSCAISKDERCRQAFDQVWDVDWSRNPIDPRNFIGKPHRIRKLVEREEYDLVHVHTPVAAFVTRFALRGVRMKGVKVVYTAHGFHFHAGGSSLKNALFLALEKAAARWTDALVVINREDEQAANRHRFLPPNRVRYMPGIGVDTAVLRPEAVSPEAVAAVRLELGLAAEDRLLLMIAEFNPGKRHRETLQAFARLGRSDVHLAFAGLGPLETKMQSLARELGVEERVRFLGWRSDIPALIRASVATLLPSEREGLPRSVMESLALGVAVVGTDIRGIRDLLVDGGGLLVPVGDVERLAAAMATLVDRPDVAAAMGRQGREQVIAFDVRGVVKLHEALYYEVLGIQEAHVPSGLPSART